MARGRQAAAEGGVEGLRAREEGRGGEVDAGQPRECCCSWLADPAADVAAEEEDGALSLGMVEVDVPWFTTPGRFL